MEIIKDLPEVFEEFAEQRQKSFLAVKQLKDKGIPVIGSRQQKRIYHVTYAH